MSAPFASPAATSGSPDAAPTFRFQPDLDPEQRPRGQSGAAWSDLGGDELVKFARALVLPHEQVAQEKVERLSLPSPWARPLLFEHAVLYGRSHPARAQILGEWRGLLGAVALSELLGKGQLDVQHVPVAGTPLEAMRPGTWRAMPEVTLLKWGRHTIGGSSPATLVFTSRRKLPVNVGIPFVERGRLVDPVEWYGARLDGTSGDAARQALVLLAAWLRHTIAAMAGHPTLEAALGSLAGEGDRVTRRYRLLTELRAWQGRCAELLGGEEAVEEAAATHRLDEAVELFHGPLAFLRPVFVKVEERPHPLSLLVAPNVVVDPTGDDRMRVRLLDRGGRPYEGTLALGPGHMIEVRDGVIVSPPSAARAGARRVLPLRELFEPRLIHILDKQVNAQFAHLLVVGTARYFLPLTEQSAPYLDDATLASVVAEERRDRGVITMTLDLRLQSGLVLRVERDFPKVATEVALSDLWIWPDFEHPEWHAYFWANSAPAGGASEVVRIAPVQLEGAPRPVSFRTEDAAGPRWGLSTTPLRLWGVTCAQSDDRGLLVVRPPADAVPAVQEHLLGKPWRVALDFGSTHTLAFVQTENSTQPVELPLRDRTVHVLGGSTDVEYQFFTYRQEPGTPAGAPTLLWAPVGQPQDPRNAPGKRWLPGHGMAFFGTSVPSRRWSNVYADLKWRPTASGKDQDEANTAFKNYLSHLSLLIASEAAVHGADLEAVYGSYPGVFSHNQRKTFAATLAAAVDAINPEAPAPASADDDRPLDADDEADGVLRARSPRAITVQLPCDEATALESFLLTRGGVNARNGVFAVDIGGSTSDFVVRRAIVAGEPEPATTYASIHFAGGVVNRIIGADDRMCQAVERALRSDFIRLDDRKVQRIMRLLDAPGKRTVGAGLLIRWLAAGDAGVSMRDFSQALLASRTSSSEDGARIIAAVAYLFAVNAFFMGLLAHPAEKGRERAGYMLHFAGRGSLLLEWISSLRDGPINEQGQRAGEHLVSHFFRAGVNAEAVARGAAPVAFTVRTKLPDEGQVKREVAVGLLQLSDNLRRQAQLMDKSYSNLIGEIGLVDERGAALEWNTVLTPAALAGMEPPGLGFSAGELPVLRQFVTAFSTLNLGVRELNFARLLKLTPESLDDFELTDRIIARFFGEGTAWERARADRHADDSLNIEPFFVSAAKALLEYGLDVPRLF